MHVGLQEVKEGEGETAVFLSEVKNSLILEGRIKMTIMNHTTILYLTKKPMLILEKRHFLIKYNKETKGYYLRDLGDGNGTFVRLDTSLQLKTGYIISFGDSHMFIQITDDFNESFSKLEIKFLDGPKTDQSFSFIKRFDNDVSEINKTIKIGRMNDCDIKFNSKGLSRCQCIIEFINGCWILKDGDGTRNSTNGTWLFADEFYPIHDEMVFKAGQILFKCTFA